MKKAYLLMGGNLGDRLRNLKEAADALRKLGNILSISSYYETAAWGKLDQPAFVNQALVLETNLAPGQLLERLLRIEQQIGRIRKEKYGPRLIDIDILLYDQLVLNSATLQVPHPQLPNRRFALTPLAEIVPDLQHPVLHKSIAALLNLCPDTLEVKKLLTDERPL